MSDYIVARKIELAPIPYFEVAKDLIRILESNQIEFSGIIEEKDYQIENLTKEVQELQEYKAKITEEHKKQITDLKTEYEQIIEELNDSVNFFLFFLY